MILSIIVPAFNVERLIGKCLASITESRAFDRVEVIVVDDGSTDKTLIAAQAAAAMCPNIRVVKQPNSGLGAARNRGLEYSVGRYIWFIDSDDFLEEGAL